MSSQAKPFLGCAMLPYLSSLCSQVSIVARPGCALCHRLWASNTVIRIAAMLAVLVPSLSVVFGLLGGTFAVLFCFYLPVMLYVRIVPTEKWERSIYLLLLCCICCLGMASVATSIYELFV